MSGIVGERVGHNESVIRQINERIEAGQWPTDEPAVFRCECAMLRCADLVELTLAQYEQVRSNSRWFVLVPGHEIPGQEVVVHEGEGFVVVEKVGSAGAEAQAEDPREPEGGAAQA